MKVAIEYKPEFAGMAVWIYQENPDGSIDIVEPIDLTITHNYGRAEQPKPTFKFSRREGEEFLQSFADALRQAGFKPPIPDESGRIAALAYHLEDMRKLVFKGKLSQEA